MNLTEKQIAELKGRIQVENELAGYEKLALSGEGWPKNHILYMDRQGIVEYCITPAKFEKLYR